MKKIWTDEEKIILIELRKTLKAKEISLLLNKSISSVYNICKLLDCNPEKDYTFARNSKFGRRLYYIYRGINNRCYNQNLPEYQSYGGRGISVCLDWKLSFKKFYNWAIQNGYQSHLTIDRINNNGNYEPSNCRWATRFEQGQNRRTNIYIKAFGETKTIAEWSRDKRCRCSYDALRERIHSKIDSEIAIVTIPGKIRIY